MSVLIIFLVVLATARLTRLVTSDSLTQPLRDKLYVASVAGDEWHQPENRVIHRPSKLASFQRFLVKVTDCDWCASVWLGAGVAALAYWSHGDAWFLWPALALAASHLVGLLSAFEGHLYGD